VEENAVFRAHMPNLSTYVNLEQPVCVHTAPGVYIRSSIVKGAVTAGRVVADNSSQMALIAVVR